MPLIRLWIADQIRFGGFTVLEAANADEAVQILGSSVKIDLVLTDIRMPGKMDGIALAERLHREHPEIKVIVVSAHPAA